MFRPVCLENENINTSFVGQYVFLVEKPGLNPDCTRQGIKKVDLADSDVKFPTNSYVLEKKKILLL
jgi:hypothetical protein